MKLPVLGGRTRLFFRASDPGFSGMVVVEFELLSLQWGEEEIG
jgi:hypothetical protein